MAKRYPSYDRVKGNSRKAAKLQYIRSKNLMTRWPECAYDGDFYCNVVYDPAFPWMGVDFKFFHSTQKKYFAVAMMTATMQAVCDIEDESWARIEPLDDGPELVQIAGGPFWEFGPTSEEYKAKMLDREQYVREQTEIPRIVHTSISTRAYSRCVTGVYATVNKPYIDEHVIREFIHFYRELGEPTGYNPKIIGDAVEVLPKEINPDGL